MVRLFCAFLIFSFVYVSVKFIILKTDRCTKNFWTDPQVLFDLTFFFPNLLWIKFVQVGYDKMTLNYLVLSFLFSSKINGTQNLQSLQGHIDQRNRRWEHIGALL